MALSPSLLAQACELWAKGEVVGIPTETVYGLAADATSSLGVEKIFSLKGRPPSNPLIVHVGSLHQGLQYGQFCSLSHALAEIFWPGPLTLVVPLRSPIDSSHPSFSPLVTAGRSTVGIRCPRHAVMQDLLQAYPHPLAAPSANLSMNLSPTSYAHVKDVFGEKIPLILEGGSCVVGVESTIVKVEQEKVKILRPGGISYESLQEVMGNVIVPYVPVISSSPESPGLMDRHYAPSRPLRLNALCAEPNEAFLGFGPMTERCDLNLSATGDLEEAARHLFWMLRLLDRPPYSSIAVAPIPQKGLGLAINDRLTRGSYSTFSSQETSL